MSKTGILLAAMFGFLCTTAVGEEKVNALVPCGSCNKCEICENEECCPNAEVNVSGKLLKQTDSEYIIELTIEARQEQGVPMLDKIPYISKLFKNVGVGKEAFTIRVPRGPGQAVLGQIDVEFDAECAPQVLGYPSTGAQFAVPGQCLPLATADLAAALHVPPTAPNGYSCPAAACAPACANTCPSNCPPAYAASCQAASCQAASCQAACPPCPTTCPPCQEVAAACDGPSCNAEPPCCVEVGCGSHPAHTLLQALANPAEMLEELVQAHVQAAALEARIESYEERDEFIEAYLESQVENAKLQATLEMAEEREQFYEAIVEAQVEAAQAMAKLEMAEAQFELYAKVQVQEARIAELTGANKRTQTVTAKTKRGRGKKARRNAIALENAALKKHIAALEAAQSAPRTQNAPTYR